MTGTLKEVGDCLLEGSQMGSRARSCGQAFEIFPASSLPAVKALGAVCYSGQWVCR